MEVENARLSVVVLLLAQFNGHQKFDRFELEMGRAIRPLVAEREPHVSISVAAQPILRNRWTQGIPTEALEQPGDPSRDDGDHISDIVAGEAPRRMKVQEGALRGEDAVDHECMDVDVQVQRATEPLDDGHLTAATIRDAVPPCALTQKPEQGARVHPDDRATKIVIPRQQIPKPVRRLSTHSTPPRTNRAAGTPACAPARRGTHDRPVERHAQPCAGRHSLDKPATLARERHQSIEPATVTMKTSEPGRQTAAAQKVSELLLDEPRQAFTITQRCGACAERLEVVEHDLM